MASKLLLIHFVLAVAMFPGRLEGRGGPAIHFINMFTDLPVTVIVYPNTQIHVKPGQESILAVKEEGAAIKVFANRAVYYTENFYVYEPRRDKGKAAVYWRADGEGFAISYDKNHWKLVAPWVTA